MSWFRRRRNVGVATAGPPEGEALPDLTMAPRLERALVALAVHAQQLDTRLERLERRLDADADALIDVPTQEDMIEVQVRTARVAAELTRLAVELRGEIEAIATTARRDDSARDALLLKLATPAVDGRPASALHADIADLPPAASA